MTGLLFGTMFLLIFIGLPVAFAIELSGVALLALTGLKPMVLIAQRLATGLDSFQLLAVPLFILVGNLMGEGGISRRLVDWAETLVGHMPGGLGCVTIVASAFFAALTGSGPATVAGIGAIMIPSMVAAGYTKERAAGLAAAAGALGPVIPPSIPMIVYGITMNVSVPAMFMAGFIPGLFIALSLIGVNTYYSFKSPAIMASRSLKPFSINDFFRKTIAALGALLLPFIILGGIYGGIFTPTEAAAIGVAYSLFVSLVIYKELHIKDLPKMLINTMEMSAMVGLIIAAANVLTWMIAITKTSDIIVTFLSGFIAHKAAYLIIVNLFLIFVGALMDTVASIIIFAPVLVPIGIQLGLEPLHIGVLFCINLVIGYITPPFGYNLFTAVALTKLKFEQVVRGVLPFMITEMVCIFILAFCPWLITWLPAWLGMR
ncbi:hypothetical protein FACS189460_4140 [Deltaproteobacteria bacterium]|nr:hypothetical protein FACS189460_4140 [Deltaproteobacteria bacterium]